MCPGALAAAWPDRGWHLGLTTAPVRALGILVGTAVLAVIAAISLGADLPAPVDSARRGGGVRDDGHRHLHRRATGRPVYQREQGPRVRASLSLFLCVGNCLAVAALSLAGRLPAAAVEVGLFFLACAAVGLATGPWFRRFLDAGRIRAGGAADRGGLGGHFDHP